MTEHVRAVHAEPPHPAAPRAKPAGIALSGDHLAALLEDPRLTARLDASGLAFAVAGIDRVDGSVPAPGARTVESTVAIAALAARAPRIGWLAAAAVHRDHPYNLARRIASADHLSDGRSGLVLGLSDGYAPAGRDGYEVWGGAGLTAGAPIAVATTRDAAAAIGELWQSWPYESIIADRQTRIYARGEQIVHIGHRGVFDIDGPLTVPTTPQGSPVLAWYARTAEEAEAVRGVADVLIRPVGQEHGPGAAAAGGPGKPRLFVEVPAEGGHLGSRLCTHPADDQVAGVILRPAREEPALREFVDDIVPELIAAGVIHAATGSGTLRERLSLPAPAPRATAWPGLPRTGTPERASLTRPASQDLHSERAVVPVLGARSCLYSFLIRSMLAVSDGSSASTSRNARCGLRYGDAQVVAQCGPGVVGPQRAALLEQRDDLVDELVKAAGGEVRADDEPVRSVVLYEGVDALGHLQRRADELGAAEDVDGGFPQAVPVLVG